MRVLLLLGTGRATGQGDAAPDGALLAALEGSDVAVQRSPEINPDLDGCDLVHLLAAAPIEHAVRQFLHARRWGRAIVASAVGPATAVGPDPVGRYERALWRLIGDGAERSIALAGTYPPFGEATTIDLVEAGAGGALRAIYAEALEERATMVERDGEAAGRWVRVPSAEDYAKHLEDLIQLQLELIAYRDAEYESRRDAEEAQQRSLAVEYARLGAWSRDVEARHEALQAEYGRLRDWAADLEARLRDARPGGLRARAARALRRR